MEGNNKKRLDLVNDVLRLNLTQDMLPTAGRTITLTELNEILAFFHSVLNPMLERK